MKGLVPRLWTRLYGLTVRPGKKRFGQWHIDVHGIGEASDVLSATPGESTLDCKLFG